MTLQAEILRKAIHLLTLVIPVGYLFFPRQIVLFILGAGLFLSVGVEVLRFCKPTFSRWFNGVVGSLLRERERYGLTGFTYLLMGSFLAVLLFDRWVALTALMLLVVSDALCAVFGRLLGRHFFYENKSIEGCAVFLLTGIVIVFIVPGGQIPAGLAGVGVAFVIDTFVKRIDDNLAIPLGAGGVMQLRSRVAG